MSLLLLLASLLCGAAARGAPTTLRCLPEPELDGYCRRRCLDGDAPVFGGEPAVLRDLSDSELYGYCQARHVKGAANFTSSEFMKGQCWSQMLSCLDVEYARPDFSADGIFIATDATIRSAVSLWSSNRTAAEAKYGHIWTWETSGVTNMSWLFCVRKDWMNNHPWDKTNVPDDYRRVLPYYKDECILSSSSFNDDISAWNTSSVTSMHAMFYGASSFDQPIGDWNVEQVTNMQAMFAHTQVFNKPIGNWQVGKVTKMVAMFDGASSFDQPIGDWRVDKVFNMEAMFVRASAFNQPLGEWQVGGVLDMSYMFKGASSFNQPLQDWSEVLDKRVSISQMFKDAKSFDQDLGWCVDESASPWGYDVDDESTTLLEAFNGTLCESTDCGVNKPRCQRGSKHKSKKETKKERNIALTIASVLFVFLLLLGCALGSYSSKQKVLELERSDIVQEQVAAARDQVKEFQAHFVTIAGPRFLAFDKLRPHEECRDELIIYDLVADVHDASTRGEVFIFFSHQWLGWSEPDPQRIHVKAMQQAVRAVCTDTDTPLEKIRVWVDYVSIPQKNHRERALAIASLPTFASVSDYFIVIAPNATHTDACCPCDSRTYRRRAWCRAEIFACWARNGTSDMYYNTNAGLKPLVVSDEILHEALDVMSGEAEYTCCRLGHPNCDPCDREALMLPLLGLYADIYAERKGKHADAYAFIEPVKSRLFPETFEYVHKGLDGVEATTTQVLFGDLVAAVEETIDDESARTKGFKPGTNAQRHRFYRHGSSDVSSRFAGLTSMVRESFRASLRRVNVASETDSEKESPAAARPAARPQLSWRASAPEYGTFES